VTNAPRPARWLHAVDAVPGVDAIRPDGQPQTEITRRGRRLVVRGELDFASVSALVEALGRIRTERGSTIVVDLARSTFVDSSVVAALLQAEERMRRLEGGLVVVAAPGAVRRTLELTGACATLRLLEAERDPPTERGAPALRLLRGGAQQV
jgi:anti-anti-sigma factor